VLHNLKYGLFGPAKYYDKMPKIYKFQNAEIAEISQICPTNRQCHSKYIGLATNMLTTVKVLLSTVLPWR
jgi:hypothetical protein